MWLCVDILGLAILNLTSWATELLPGGIVSAGWPLLDAFPPKQWNPDFIFGQNCVAVQDSFISQSSQPSFHSHCRGAKNTPRHNALNAVEKRLKRDVEFLKPSAWMLSAHLCKEKWDENCQSPTKWPPVGQYSECYSPNNQKKRSWCQVVGHVLTAQQCRASMGFAINHQK